jgi:hypothetical protein
MLLWFAEISMRVSMLPVAILALGVTCGAALAQSPTPPDVSPSAASTDAGRGPQSSPIPGAAARRQKRAQCNTKAKEENLRLFARMRFLRRCVKS